MLCSMTAALAQPWPKGVYEVGSFERFKEVISHRMSSDGKCIAEIKLTADIYLKDEGELCNTFTGTLDGNGYTIYAGDETAHHDDRGLAHGKYLFTYSEGATFKNLTFKDFRADTDEHSNWSILTSQATNGCVFENITFDHVSIWSNCSNVGAVAGIAKDCTFTNITVKNSDFTVDDNYASTVVGNAKGCTFTNIEVINCEATADDDYAGGVVGNSDNCTFNGVKVQGSYITVYGEYSGGVAGNANDSHFIACTTDDQTCVFCDGSGQYGNVGGMVSISQKCTFTNCINSALIACKGNNAGGLVGYAGNASVIEGCLNTGLITALSFFESVDKLFEDYKNKKLPCVTKLYKGKEYIVRIKEEEGYRNYLAGIAGELIDSSVSKCTNFGSVCGAQNVGGIVGYAWDATITYCLCDFKAHSNAYIICGKGKGYTSIKNCLSATKDRTPFPIIENTEFGNIEYTYGEVEHNYTIGQSDYYNSSVTEAQLASGIFCYTFGSPWEQNLGTDPYPTPTGNDGMSHTRIITNEYGTAYLPYSMNSDENIRFYTFKEDTSDDEGVKLKFIYEENVPARTPVLFRVSGTPTAENPLTITLKDSHDGYWWRDAPVDISGWAIEGTTVQRIFEGEEAKSIYYVSGGKIRNAQKTTIAPYRAYFHGPSIETLNGSNGAPAKAIRFVLEDEDGETTAIEFADFDFNSNSNFNFNGKTYSIMGTQVNEDYRGIVIKNGKKYLNN